ncbi:hypothetical protein [Nocardia sp. NPDC052566]|uniref:Rv1733c family protein n=1 Tax=Nocardia sp. NPDC052566 TaxID=3364330 RepID=UPI0037C85228
MAERGAPVGGRRARVTRLMSYAPWNPNPLMRTGDRLEAVFRLVVIVAMLAAIPIAGAFGTASYASDAARIRAESATKSVVTATITAEPGVVDLQHVEARVQWNAGNRTGAATVPVPRDARRGELVPVWLDRAGEFTTAPRPPAAAAARGVSMGLAALFGTWAGGWCLVQSFRWLLNRGRNAQWDREWRQLARPTTEGWK